MIIEKIYKSDDITKTLNIELSNGDHVRIYDNGDGYSSIAIGRHESHVEKSNGSDVTCKDKETEISKSRICKSKEITISDKDKLTSVSVKHFHWRNKNSK
tara:strand:+ start:424 stop:723 length:300 start_codon:yes stop_codon:yes gene_type:complete